MPQIKTYKGTQIKRTQRIVDNRGQVMIKLTFKGEPNRPGPQSIVSENDYKTNVKITYIPPKSEAAPSPPIAA